MVRPRICWTRLSRSLERNKSSSSNTRARQQLPQGQGRKTPDTELQFLWHFHHHFLLNTCYRIGRALEKFRWDEKIPAPFSFLPETKKWHSPLKKSEKNSPWKLTGQVPNMETPRIFEFFFFLLAVSCGHGEVFGTICLAWFPRLARSWWPSGALSPGGRFFVGSEQGVFRSTFRWCIY